MHATNNLRMRFSVVLLGAAVSLSVGCKRLPEDSYAWHTELAKTRGALTSFVGQLPLGTRSALDHYHPEDEDDDTIVISNIEELSPFLARQDKALAWALATYDVAGTVAKGFAYAALVDPKAKPQLDKEKETSGHPTALSFGNGPSVSTTFRTRRVQGTVASATGCRLYAIDGSASVVGGMPMMAGVAAMTLEDQLDYIVLAGAKRNLYLELALPAQILGEDKTYAYPPNRPLKPLAWSKDPLALLRRAHDASRTGVCTFTDSPVKAKENKH